MVRCKVRCRLRSGNGGRSCDASSPMISYIYIYIQAKFHVQHFGFNFRHVAAEPVDERNTWEGQFIRSHQQGTG